MLLLSWQGLQTVDFPAETEDNKAVKLAADVHAHLLPIGAVELDGIVPDFVEAFQVKPVRRKGRLGALPVFLVLEINPNPETRKHHGQIDQKMVPCL